MTTGSIITTTIAVTDIGVLCERSGRKAISPDMRINFLLSIMEE